MKLIYTMQTGAWRCVVESRAMYIISLIDLLLLEQVDESKAQSKISLYLQKVTFLSVRISRESALRKRLPSSLLSPFVPCALRSRIGCVSRNWIYINAIETSLKLKAPFTRQRRNVTALYKPRLTILRAFPPRPPLDVMSYFLTISKYWNISSIITRIFRPEYLEEFACCVSGLKR